MKAKSSSPTMKDVAREAGVAVGTVSKVFNNIPVGDSYRRRVEEAARRLDYRVNNYARGLRISKTYTVAVILPSLTHPFYAALADELTRALMAQGYRTVLALTSRNWNTEQQCIEMLRDNKADGIIALTHAPNLTVDEDLPFVSIDRYYGPAIPCVSSDNFGGGQLAAETLVKLGCKRLLFLRTGTSFSSEPDKRGIGFEAYCQAHQLDHTMVNMGDVEYDSFESFLRDSIADGKLTYDGIFCSSDMLASRIGKLLKEMGVRVPEDVQLIGYDGLPNSISGEYCCSTIVQPIRQMAETAVELLLSMDTTKRCGLICLPVTYQQGGTTRE